MSRLNAIASFLLALCIPFPGLAEVTGEGAQHGVKWTWYRIISADQGRREFNMGQHTFCALSAYQQGGRDGYCSVGQNLGDWILVAIDQDDTARSQTCYAVCMDIPGLGIAPTPQAGADAGPRTPDAPPALPALAGKWVAYRGGKKIADCSIQQSGSTLTFTIHRNPADRSTGRLIGIARVEATDWGGEKGTVSPDGRRITWSNSYWERVD
jgi:hypothetical protein